MKRSYILSAIGICLLILLSLFTLYLFKSLSMYENELLLITCIFSFIIIICTTFYFSKKIAIYNIGMFIMFLCNVLLIYNIIEINRLNGFVSNLFTGHYNYIMYDIYVQKKNPYYSDISKLEKKKIGVLDENKENIQLYLDNLVDVEIIIYNSLDEIKDAIEGGEIQSFVLEDTVLSDSDNDIKYKVRSIYRGKIKEAI